MTLVFEQIVTPGIAQLSYLIGDDGSGTAAVIDPRAEVQIYLDIARRHGLAITHVMETHIHADFMSGARELIHRLGAGTLCVSKEGDARYGFDLQAIKDGDAFEFGSVVLTARHTPGHTPEHMAYVVSEQGSEDRPWAVFTGDSLFVGSAGRPDLLGDEQTDELTKSLFHTLREFYLKLDDAVVIYPCHGAGSACGADIGDRPVSTIGFERRTNKFLQIEDFVEFKKFVEEGAPPEPSHYKRLKKLNSEGPPVLGNVPPVPALPPRAFQNAIEKGDSQLVDTRQMLAFGGGHISGALNIGDRPELSVWAGEMLDPDLPILLVVEDETDLDRIVWLLVNTGFTKFSGYLAGGMKAWENAGLKLQTLPQITVHELRESGDTILPLDVRSESEWEEGHLPNAKHHYVAEMRQGLSNGLSDIPNNKPIAVYCGSGYRASLAASILQANGYQDVRNFPGSWLAWRERGYPIEK